LADKELVRPHQEFDSPGKRFSHPCASATVIKLSSPTPTQDREAYSPEKAGTLYSNRKLNSVGDGKDAGIGPSVRTSTRSFIENEKMIEEQAKTQSGRK